MTSVVFLYQVFGMHVFLRFPCVVRRWIALPFDQILQTALAPVVSVIDDRLDFVLLRVFDQVRWGSREIRAVSGRFSVGQEKGGVEHIVNTPRQGECELVCHWRDYFADTERPLTSRGQFRGMVRQF